MLDQEEFDDLAVSTYRSSDVAAAKVALAELIELARDGRLPGRPFDGLGTLVSDSARWHSYSLARACLDRRCAWLARSGRSTRMPRANRTGHRRRGTDVGRDDVREAGVSGAVWRFAPSSHASRAAGLSGALLQCDPPADTTPGRRPASSSWNRPSTPDVRQQHDMRVTVLLEDRMIPITEPVTEHDLEALAGLIKVWADVRTAR